MVVRFFSALGWIFFLFAFVAMLLAYANFPDEVLVYVNDNGVPVTYLSKDSLFYLMLAFLVLMNATVPGLARILHKAKWEAAWTLTGLHISQIFYNMFFASSVYFIAMLNSSDILDYSNFGYLVYVSGTFLTVAVIYTLAAGLIVKK